MGWPAETTGVGDAAGALVGEAKIGAKGELVAVGVATSVPEVQARVRAMAGQIRSQAMRDFMRPSSEMLQRSDIAGVYRDTIGLLLSGL
jgi:hypothetical protein